MMTIKSMVWNDKILHFCVCMLLCMSFGCLVVHVPKFLVLAAGYSFAMTIGILKEVYDMYNGGVFDWKDIVADFFGAITGVALMSIVFYVV